MYLYNVVAFSVLDTYPCVYKCMQVCILETEYIPSISCTKLCTYCTILYQLCACQRVIQCDSIIASAYLHQSCYKHCQQEPDIPSQNDYKSYGKNYAGDM